MEPNICLRCKKKSVMDKREAEDTFGYEWVCRSCKRVAWVSM